MKLLAIEVYNKAKSSRGVKMGVGKLEEENTCKLLDTKRLSAVDKTLKLYLMKAWRIPPFLYSSVCC